jgi:hypothetical protein
LLGRASTCPGRLVTQPHWEGRQKRAEAVTRPPNPIPGERIEGLFDGLYSPIPVKRPIRILRTSRWLSARLVDVESSPRNWDIPASLRAARSDARMRSKESTTPRAGRRPSAIIRYTVAQHVRSLIATRAWPADVPDLVGSDRFRPASPEGHASVSSLVEEDENGMKVTPHCAWVTKVEPGRTRRFQRSKHRVCVGRIPAPRGRNRRIGAGF